MALIEKMVSIQGWGDERLQDEQPKGMHTMIETDMLVAKMDLLIKRLDERAHEKEAMHGIVKAMELHMTCEVYGESGHSGKDCPKTHRMTPISTMGSVHKEVIMGGTINHVQHSKKVIRTSIPITIRINLS